MSWLSSLGGALGRLVASPGSTSPASLIRTAAPGVLDAIVSIAAGRGTLEDGETIVDAILEGVALVDPAAAPVIMLAIDAGTIALALIAAGVIKPGASGEGWTTQTQHRGRNG